MRGIVDAAGIVSGGEPPMMRKMFGHETWFLNGYMFTSANEDGIFVHLGEAAAAKAIDDYEALIPFSPGRGTIMKSYALISGVAAADEAIVASWLRTSADYLTSLPRKEPKSKKKKS